MAATETIAWIAIGIGVFMQVFASLLPGGTSLSEPFEDLPEVTGIITFAQFVTTFILDVFQFMFLFISQSWASEFPIWIHFPIIVIFNLAILLFLVTVLASLIPFT